MELKRLKNVQYLIALDLLVPKQYKTSNFSNITFHTPHLQTPLQFSGMHLKVRHYGTLRAFCAKIHLAVSDEPVWNYDSSTTRTMAAKNRGTLELVARKFFRC